MPSTRWKLCLVYMTVVRTPSTIRLPLSAKRHLLQVPFPDPCQKGLGVPYKMCVRHSNWHPFSAATRHKSRCLSHTAPAVMWICYAYNAPVHVKFSLTRSSLTTGMHTQALCLLANWSRDSGAVPIRQC